MKELPWDNWRFQADISKRIEDRFSVHPGGEVGLTKGVLDGSPSRFETGIAALEQGEHVGGHQCIGQSCGCTFLPNLPQVEGVSGIKVDDSIVAGQGANARLPNRVLKSDESHWRCWVANPGDSTSLLLRHWNCLCRVLSERPFTVVRVIRFLKAHIDVKGSRR